MEQYIATHDSNLVTCHLVYKIKRTTNGRVDRQKARLVARGFNQIEGVDFDETYNPKVTFPTI